MTFTITIDTTQQDPLFLQIATRVRTAIAAGHLLPGARLPSSRALAAKLAIARGTVDAAYALLAGEGAIETHRSAGTVVAGKVGPRVDLPEQAPLLFPAVPNAVGPGPRPFQIGLPALDAFPRKLWSNLTVRAARSIQADALADADPGGLLDLRQSVAAYLGVARGISCTAEQVLITCGYQGALALVRNVLVRANEPVWMEDPGYHLTRMALENAGARVVPIRVDADGLRVAAGNNAAPKARLVVVTPTHQYPLGVALSLPRRLQLLAWAAEAGSWILEDDYDSEFRYVGRPLPSLKSLDRGERVLYTGSFSKVLFPALRLGYLVVPPELESAFQRAAKLLTNGLPVLEQTVVAAFMRSGHFPRHVKRMRTLYAERRRALAAALHARFGERATVDMAPGGMHLIVRFAQAEDDTALAKRAVRSGLAPTALSSLAIAHDCGQGLLLSFTNVAPADADALVARLAAAIG
jgi:GntR family transcriptional regulator/MocR family aminotransferase